MDVLPYEEESDMRWHLEVDGPWAGRKEEEARRKDFDGLKRRWVRWPAGLLFFLFPFFSGNSFFFSCSILLGKKMRHGF
jgi:hypothetical protein